VVSAWGLAEGFLESVAAFEFDFAAALAAGSAAFLAADFFEALLAGGFFAEGDFFELVAEFAAGEEAVEGAGAFGVAFDFEAGGEVLEIDAGAGLVDLLSSVSGAADEFFGEVFLADAEFLHAFLQGVSFFAADHGRDAG